MEGPGGRLIAAGGESEAVRGAGSCKIRRGGFSLMEVLFAVLVLTLGLVFVAANFPLGIMNAGKVAESTRNIIDTHNAQIMTELQLGGIGETDYFGNASPSYIIKDGEIRLLSMPNVRVDGYVVMDDPCESYFTTSKDPDPKYHIYDSTDGIDASGGELPYFIQTDDTNVDENLYRKNIGMMVSPMVDRSDAQVLTKLNSMYDLSLADVDQPPGFLEDLDIAIYDVAIERNYGWCSLYRHITGNTYSLYIFTLRRHNKNARYAIQEKTEFDDGEPIPGDQDYDRLFPVPWRIVLDPLKPPAPEGYDNFILEDHTVDQLFADRLAEILQGGSIIIDADAQNGHIYKVIEIVSIEDVGWMVRLDRMLIDPLLKFWVVPPPIVRMGQEYIFEGKQPVMKVTRRNFRI